MRPIDFILLGVIAAAAGAALWVILKKKLLRRPCGGDCAHCAAACREKNK